MGCVTNQIILATVAVILLLVKQSLCQCNRTTDSPTCWFTSPICKQDGPYQTFQAGLPVRDDTLGGLLSNRMLWRIPGIDQIAQGFNLFTGTKANYPTFLFCYQANSQSTRRLQDTYRGNVYEIPNDVYATSYPQCSFTAESSEFSSAQEFAMNMAASAGISTQNSASGRVYGVPVQASAMFSADISVTTALNIQSKRAGSLSVTTAECLTSSIQIDYRSTSSLHPQFVHDLYKTDSHEMAAIIDRYGTHFYKGAVMGGKIVQITSTDEMYRRSQTEVAMEANLNAGISGGVNVLKGKISATSSVSLSTSLQSEFERMEEFEEQTTKSSILSYGGAPGSFGPTASMKDNGISGWADWAQSVDLLPIPIRYELGEISELIPEDWKDASGQYMQQKWMDSVRNYLKLKQTQIVKKEESHYLFFLEIGYHSDPSKSGFGIKLYNGEIRPHLALPFESELSNGIRVKKYYTVFNYGHGYTYEVDAKEVPGFSGLVSLCNLFGMEGGDATDMALWNLHRLTLVDKYYGRIYTYSLHNVLYGTTAGCIDLIPSQLRHDIRFVLTLTCTERCTTVREKLIFRVSMIGSTAVLNYYVKGASIFPENTNFDSPLANSFHTFIHSPTITSAGRSIDIGNIQRTEIAILEDFQGKLVVDGSKFYLLHTLEFEQTVLESTTHIMANLSKTQPLSFGMRKL